MEPASSPNLAPLKALLAVILPTVFVYLAKKGWITGLTPENAHLYVSAVLDWLVAIVPLGVGIWAAFKSTRAKLIERTNALPGVLGIAVTPALDAKLPDMLTVTTPERLQTAIVIDSVQRGPSA